MVLSPTEAIRQRLKDLLATHRDIKQRDVAEAIGQAPSFISMVLKGTRDCKDIEDIARIARRFGVSIGYLIGESGGKHGGTLDALLAVAERLTPPALDALLSVARTLPTRETPPSTPTVATSRRGTTPPESPARRGRKRR